MALPTDWRGLPIPKDFGFTRRAKKLPPAIQRMIAPTWLYHKHYAALPHRDRGTYLKLAHGTGRIIVPPKKKELPPGSYVMRVRVGAVEGTPAERRFIQVGHPQRLIESRNWGLEGPAISTHQVTGTIENPETIEIPLEVTANTIREFAVQEKQPNNGNLKALWNAHNEWKTKNGYGHPSGHLDRLGGTRRATFGHPKRIRVLRCRRFLPSSLATSTLRVKQNKGTLPLGARVGRTVAAGEGTRNRRRSRGTRVAALPARSSRPSQREGG